MKIKRMLAALTVAGLAVAGLVGCGRSDTTATTSSASPIATGPATGELTMWAMGAEGDALSTLTKKFEAENPGVKVTVTAIPWSSAHDKFTSAIAAGTTPDLAMVGTTWMGEMASLKALDQVPSTIDQTKFFEGANATNVVGGASYGVPWYVETRVVYYRKDLAAAAGITAPPTDWQGLYDLAAALKKQPGVKWPFGLQPGGTGSWQAVLPLMWSQGGDIANADLTQFTFDSAPNTEALAYYQKFFTDKLADPAPSGSDAGADLVSGKVPMFISGPWMLSSIDKLGGAGFKDKYGVFLMPKGKVSATSFVGGSNLAVFNKTKNRDAAWKLVDYLTQEKTQVEWFETVSALPSVKAAWNDPKLQADDRIAVFGKQLETAKAPPPLTTWDQIAASLDGQIEQVTKNGVDPATGLKTVQDEATGIGFGGK